jgi:PAS domain S-box-containing protein
VTLSVFESQVETRLGVREELQTLRGENKARELLEALPTATYTTDTAGRLTYYNKAAADLWGYRPELGKAKWCGSWRLYWPDGTPLPHDECPMAVALKEDRPIRGVEAIAERPDGTRVSFIPYPTPLHDESGALVGAINMLVDISERKRADEAAQWLAAIVENSHDAIVSKDLNGIITSWNSGAERLFGYTAGEAIGKSITMLIPPDRRDEEPEILRRIRRGEHVDHYETVRMRKDGSLVDVSLTVSPVKDANGNIIRASKIARDISERKQAQARQELLTREIQHRTKNLFAIVQAVVVRSLAGKQTVEDAKSAVLSRLSSLAQTHVMLMDTQWEGADLRGIVEAEMRPFAGRVRIEGPKVMLTSKAAQNFGLAVHELVTNAAKYGALSNSTGQIDISWSVGESNGSRTFAFRWQELGGPPVERPERKGFGSIVLERIMGECFAEPPQIDFAPTGVRYELSASLDAITDAVTGADQDALQR